MLLTPTKEVGGGVKGYFLPLYLPHHLFRLMKVKWLLKYTLYGKSTLVSQATVFLFCFVFVSFLLFLLFLKRVHVKNAQIQNRLLQIGLKKDKRT